MQIVFQQITDIIAVIENLRSPPSIKPEEFALPNHNIRLLTHLFLLLFTLATGITRVHAVSQSETQPRSQTEPPAYLSTDVNTLQPQVVRDSSGDEASLGPQSTTGPVPPAAAINAPQYAPSPMAVSFSVPAYLWRHGCGPTAAGMVMGYWDAHGFPMLFQGDAGSQTAWVDEGIASDDGTLNHYNDYALPMDSASPGVLADKSSTPPGDEHPSNSLADFMYTSWSLYNNRYGWSYFHHVDDSLAGYVEYINNTYGVKYTPTVTNSIYSLYGEAMWDLYKAEIDAGRPVVLLVDSDGDGFTDHFVTGVGYDDAASPRLYAALNTWDTGVHWYEFGPLTTGKPWGIYGFTTLSLRDNSDQDEFAYLPFVKGVAPELTFLGPNLHDEPYGTIWGWSNGNGDAQANAGEFIVLAARLMNSSAVNLNGLFAELTTTDPYINTQSAYQTMYNPVHSFGFLGSGQTAEFYGFQILLAQNTPNGHIVPFQLKVWDEQNNYWNYTFSVTVTGTDTTPPHIGAGGPTGMVIPTGTPGSIFAFVLEAGSLNKVDSYLQSPDGTTQAVVRLYDDGTHGDPAANDRWFTAQWVPGFAADWTVDFKATDNRGIPSPLYNNLGHFSSKPFSAGSDVLLIMDDKNGVNLTPFYTAAITASGRTYDLWESYYRGNWAFAPLESYYSKAVIFAMPNCGYLAPVCSTALNELALQAYLDQGGKLFITGQDVGYYLHSQWYPSQTLFYTNYLKAYLAQDDTNLYGIQGTASDPITDGISINISGGDGANNQIYPDEIYPTAPAVPIFTYLPSTGALQQPLESPAGTLPGGAAGLRYSGTYRLVYLSFGFEAINNAASRSLVMDRILDWLLAP